MTSELLFIVAIVAIVVVVLLVIKHGNRIRRVILDRRFISPEAEQGKPHEPKQPVTEQRKPHEPKQPVTENEPKTLTAEEKSKVELESLKHLIEERKQLAMDSDISHHLWNLYKNHFRFTSPQSLDPLNQDREWYGVKILRVSTKNNLNKFEFELNGTKYKFIDDEENRNWSEKVKLFDLFLYDDSDRCLIEIPMKVRIDSFGRKYSLLLGGPKAFLPGDWTNDFTNATLIHQSVRNKEIREQKHQERLWEIEDLKDRFGISD